MNKETHPVISTLVMHSLRSLQTALIASAKMAEGAVVNHAHKRVEAESRALLCAPNNQNEAEEIESLNKSIEYWGQRKRMLDQQVSAFDACLAALGLGAQDISEPLTEKDMICLSLITSGSPPWSREQTQVQR